MNRRDILFSGLAVVALAGCNSLPALPVKVTLPPELTQLIDDANSIVGKLGGLQHLLPDGALALLDKGKALVAQISAGTSIAGVAGFVGELVPLVQQLTGLLPVSGTAGTIVSAIETVLPIMAKVAGIAISFLGRRMIATMSVEQARAVLRG